MRDRIVESRQWSRGCEMVSRVNHTQLGRLRMALRGTARFAETTAVEQSDQPEIEPDHAQRP